MNKALIYGGIVAALVAGIVLTREDAPAREWSDWYVAKGHNAQELAVYQLAKVAGRHAGTLGCATVYQRQQWPTGSEYQAACVSLDGEITSTWTVWPGTNRTSPTPIQSLELAALAARDRR